MTKELIGPNTLRNLWDITDERQIRRPIAFDYTDLSKEDYKQFSGKRLACFQTLGYTRCAVMFLDNDKVMEMMFEMGCFYDFPTRILSLPQERGVWYSENRGVRAINLFTEDEGTFQVNGKRFSKNRLLTALFGHLRTDPAQQNMQSQLGNTGVLDVQTPDLLKLIKPLFFSRRRPRLMYEISAIPTYTPATPKKPERYSLTIDCTRPTESDGLHLLVEN
jgi:hypothetical protein